MWYNIRRLNAPSLAFAPLLIFSLAFSFWRACWPLYAVVFLPGTVFTMFGGVSVVVTKKFCISWSPEQSVHVVDYLQEPYCPECGRLCSGYDHRRRHLVNEETGQKEWYLLRRVRCPYCGHVHLDLPSCFEPRKHYAADVIERVLFGILDGCPADLSTIRRWRRGGAPAPFPAHILTYARYFYQRQAA